MVPLDAYYQGHSSLSKAKIEIATNLTNASGNPEMAGARKLAESNRIRDYGKQIPRKAADLGLFDKESIVDNDDVTVGESGQLFPQNF